MVVTNSSISSNEEGNNRTSSKSQISPSIKWCFTYNNYPEDLTDLNSSLTTYCRKAFYTKEVGESGTPHLQGYLEFKTKKRPLSCLPQMHFSKAKGNIEENYNYITKDGDLTFSLGYHETIKLPRDCLNIEQQDVADRFIEDEDPLYGRKVFWFWEEIGGWGKSVLTKYMIDHMGAIVVSGQGKDILCGITSMIEKHGYCPRLIVFDVPRCSSGHVSYSSIESIKNGYFFSGKYESGMVRFNSPHICVFANERPDTLQLSQDRWQIVYLRQQEKEQPIVDDSDEEWLPGPELAYD